MIDYKDIWSDTVLIIALMISVFAFSGYSPDVSGPSLLAPQTELIHAPNSDSEVKQFSTTLYSPEAVPAPAVPFPTALVRIHTQLAQVAFAHLSQQFLQYKSASPFSFLLALRRDFEDLPDAPARG